MTLVHRAIMICSKTKIDTEIEFIKNVLSDNSDSINLVQRLCNLMNLNY